MTYPLRPLTLGELLDRTFSLYRRHFFMFAGITAAPYVFLLLFKVALIVAGVVTPWFVLLSTVVMGFAYVVTGVFAQAATVIAVSRIQLGQPVSVGDALGAVRSRIGELVVLSMNMGIRILLGFLLFVIPGIVLMLMYALAVPVAVLEEKSISETLERSATLTKGHRGRIFVMYLLLMLLTLTVTLAWGVLAGIIITAMHGLGVGAMLTSPGGLVVSESGAFVARTAIAPVMTIALALMYYDERIRKEAFDLEHMMQQLEGAPVDMATA